MKASRFCTNRRVPADAGESIDRFIAQGLTELGDKLGPINWQFMATKKFDPEDFAAFLALLPEEMFGFETARLVAATVPVPSSDAVDRERGGQGGR